MLVSPDDAADVVADTFAQLVASSSGGWERARDPRGYLFGAVANHARIQHRSSERQKARDARHLALATADAQGSTTDGHGDDRIETALGQLTHSSGP